MGDASQRLKALKAALDKGQEKPDRWFAILLPTVRPKRGFEWLASACLFPLEGSPDALADALRDRYQALAQYVGGMPLQLQWAEAALTLRLGIDPHVYGGLRNMSDLGARTAMALCALDARLDNAAAQVNAVRKEIRPWMTNYVTGIDGLIAAYSAAHVVRGEGPDEARAANERAEAVFAAHKAAKKASKEGARACAAFGEDPERVLERFLGLLSAAESFRALKRVQTGLLLEWACYGLGEAEAEALERWLHIAGEARRTDRRMQARLAFLLWAGDAQTGASLRLAIAATALSAEAALTSAEGADSGGGV